ncbi:MAG: c-type cytochrome [Solirubrobacterales bacterium]|nr:c-type cytochrome [Solirubrobacterales bacterium]MCB8970623.1 c-type cytochrome [Thermoleophilales bacterium]MCO5326413.1 c-type cytochrome [Solirubrobacterales bacterium]
MNGARLKSALAIVLGTVAVAAISGCDAKENADLANGRQLFKSDCGVCHALKEAGTTATVGPDLDAAFAASRAAGMDNDTIEGVVADQIAEPRVTDEADPSYMPAGIVEGQDAEDVSAYVGSVAGVPGIEPPTAPGGPGGQIFANNGCTACHTLGVAQSAGNVGPNLDDVLPGQSPDQIRQDIVDPGAKIAAGFDNIMPATYGDSIPSEDLDKLINFLSTCAGIGSSGDEGDANIQFNDDGSCVAPGGGK